MRIPEYVFKIVVFLVQDRQPRATGFFVGVPDYEFEILVPYVVTARHVVEETLGRPFAVRLNAGERHHDVDTVADDWWTHHSEDVAAVRFEGKALPHGGPPFDLPLESIERFIDADYRFNVTHAMADLADTPGFYAGLSGRFKGEEFEPVEHAPVQPGDEVFFVSLLYEQPGEERNLPIGRFGHISRMPEEPILMRRTGGTIARLTAYLVECHSWGGHSGSPVFWTHPMMLLREMQGPHGETLHLPQVSNVGALMGLVSGHWDIDTEAKTEGDIVGTIRTAINSGIAVVTPASAITDLLTREDVVADRKDFAKKRRGELDARRAMTPDSVGSSGAATEFENFEDLTRKLVNKPKPDAENES